MRCAFLYHPKALQTGISLPWDMLWAADQLRSRQQRRQHPLSCQLFHLGEAPSLLQSQALSQPLIQLAGMDYLFLPPIWGNPQPVLQRYAEFGAQLPELTRSGCRLIATGTGVCWLAEQGLLDRQLATTHWYYFEQFQRLYPQVQLQPKVFITESQGLYCAGSINALSLLVSQLISRHFGVAIGRHIEAHFGQEVSRLNQQPILSPGGLSNPDEDIALCQSAIRLQLRQKWTLASMALQAQLSERTFKRRFKQSTGFSPMQWLQQERLQQGLQLLQQSNLNISEISEQLGYQDPSYFARVFQQQIGSSPQRFRLRARGKLFSSH